MNWRIYKKGCKGGLYENSDVGCVKDFSSYEIQDIILSLIGYSNKMFGGFILPQIQAVTYSDHSNKTKRHVSNYMYHETRIWRQTFCFVITVTEKKLITLKAHFMDKSAWEHQKAAKKYNLHHWNWGSKFVHRELRYSYCNTLTRNSN